ncbi:hypothetical protein PHLH6_58650 [Pseudomonas sp. Seg1]|nr:hypothetical protein PHLH6_58650 [Pseudomonas sp. Seg1]
MIYAPFPGEFIASALRRGKEIQGIINCRKFDFKIRVVKRSTRYGKWEFILPKLIEDHGLSTEVLQENTLYPLYSVLGRSPSSATYAPASTWKICTTCVVEDAEKYGSPYIHVCHLPKSVKFCHKHASYLQARCPTCSLAVSSHNLSDFIACSDSFSLETSNSEAWQQDYAVFVRDLFDFRGSAYSAVVVDEKLYSKYIKLSYKNYFHGYNSYRSDISKIFGMDFKDNRSGYQSFDLCLALAFLGFETADAFIAVVQRPSSSSAS